MARPGAIRAFSIDAYRGHLLHRLNLSRRGESRWACYSRKFDIRLSYLKWPLAALAAILALYLAFLTRTYYWDGVLFSIYIENAARGLLPVTRLIHPNHLLYTVFGFGVYSAALGLHIHARAITILQVVNAIVSTAAAYTVYRFAERLTRSATLALFCCILFAFGATWWKFSTDADAYSLAVFFEILACYFAFRERPNWLLTGTFHVLGMLIHELVIFTYIPVLAAVWATSAKDRLRVAIAYVGGTGAAIAGSYTLCYRLAADG